VGGWRRRVEGVCVMCDVDQTGYECLIGSGGGGGVYSYTRWP